ncbi:hypothetical protein [Terribacillus sp. JSM ZJ617]|uniref:hypothetical protein n=1 Tax=Terribacillus sp. JSM ZJ617 TaxID=3342119 RepID=UPI0035A842AA
MTDTFKLYKELSKHLEIDPLSLLVYLVLVILFFWLFKEIKGQFNQEQLTKKEAKNNMLRYYSEIMKHGNDYLNYGGPAREFFNSVYSGMSSMNYNSYIKVNELLNNITLTENNKIKQITDRICNEFYIIKRSEQEWHDYESNFDGYLKLIKDKVGFLIMPFISTVVIYFVLLWMLTAAISISDPLLRVVVIFLLIISTPLILIIIDATKKKLKQVRRNGF